MAKEPKEHVKKHLEKRDIPVTDLTDKAIDALNAFSEEELRRVDTLGDALMNDGMLDSNQRISAVH
jgi:hypothetical protein